VSRSAKKWVPMPGIVATYAGRAGSGARNVRVIAEASAGYMVVEAIGRNDVPVRFSVKRENLMPLQPVLFE